MFFDGFGMLEVECDAPPYPIVQACRTLWFQAPEDVRWCSQSNAHSAPPKQQSGLVAQAFHAIFRRRAGCICRCHLPELEKYKFIWDSGEEKYLLLGQCRQCLTIFWKEP